MRAPAIGRNRVLVWEARLRDRHRSYAIAIRSLCGFGLAIMFDQPRLVERSKHVASEVAHLGVLEPVEQVFDRNGALSA